MENFEVIKPSALLSPYIKNYWFLKTDIQEVVQRVIPYGCIHLIFHRDRQMYSITNEDYQPASFLSGQEIGYSDLKQKGKIDMICITFHPHAAKMFFPFSMSEIKEQTVGIELLSSPDLKELEQRLGVIYDNAACVHLIEAFFIKRLNLSKEYNFQRVEAVVKAINRGEENILRLAEHSCLGYKRFKRIFTEYIGLTPKDFLRVIRFQKSLYLHQNSPSLNLSQLALECNYYDQSHFIKDFKAFSGYTPKDYFSLFPSYSDYFS